MRVFLDRLQGLFGLLLLAAMLVGWSGVSESGGFIGPNSTLTVEITADKTTLPINILNIGPSIGGPYTNTVNVTVKQNGKLLATPINVAVATGLSSGALYYLDGDPEHEECPISGETVDDCSVAVVPIAYRQLAFEDATGIATFHFNASSAPGTVVLTASAQDPNSGKVISASLTIEVVGGSSVTGGMPAAVKFVMDTAPVYIRDNPLGTTTATQNTTKLFQIFVQDDFGQTISQGTGNVLRVEMLPNRPYGGEWLSGTSADGSARQGSSVLAGLFGGAATMALHGGTVPGTVLISATADRTDNNVDNGIQMGITNYAMVSIGTGEIKTLTFTGPLADAVFVGANNLIAVADGSLCGANACDTIWNGIYSRVISVIASDPYGNPPPEGTPITFRLIDSPLDLLQNRYPDQGHGQFAITGYTGDPQEGGLEFLAPNRKTKRTAADTLNPFVVPNGVSYAIANPLCLLMLQDPETTENRPEYHVGSRIIIGRAGNMLTVNTAFNQVSQNVGANVLYTVGCPPYKGNVANFDSNEVVVMTNANGAAHTVMNYPANQVGRRFMVAAESNGGKVGAAMTHWYLGTPDGSILTITAPAQLAAQIEPLLTDTPWPALVKVTQTVNPGEALTLPVTLQVLDGGVLSGGALKRTPIPGVSIAVDIVINDPAEAAAIVAEEAQAKAQASLDAFVAANPGVCDLVLKNTEGEPEERDPEKCATQKALATALDEAKIAAIEARTVANLHTPTASVEPATVASGTGGYARLVLNVNDLPTDGSVDFSFSTVGPEIRSEVLQITVQPPQAEEATPPPEE